VFAKALNNRLEMLCDRLLAINQTTFVKCRYTLESMVSTHEIIHEVVRGGRKGIILKLDYKKAYDRIDWDFLEEMLISRRFSQKWIQWVISLVKGGSIAIRLNDNNSTYFKPSKGLRQGDPLSILLFNLVVDLFTRMLSKAASKGYITGLMNTLCPEGVISLQYADDTLLFLKHDNLDACYLKWLMVYFEQISGMKINYHKSDMTPINLDEEEANQMAQIFCCKMGSFLFRYLGFLFIMTS
jgi:hypothetical protein